VLSRYFPQENRCMTEPVPAPDGATAVPERPLPYPGGRPERLFRTRREQVFEDADALHDDGIARANWTVPWSDLMLTMFVLFAALLAVQMQQERTRKEAQQQAQHQKTTEPRDQPVDRDRPVEHEKPVPEEALSRKPSFEPLMQINVLARSQEAVREANLQNAEIILMDDQSVKVSVQGPMFFALGKADLRPEVAQFLDRLALIIKQTPYQVHVVGHTDDLPISTAMFPTNWELSLFRGSQVARYLIKAGNLEPSRFLVMGRGEYEPAAANADERSRALNRRVEIIITRSVTDTEKARRR
jgi:chemotaxis protein MotB